MNLPPPIDLKRLRVYPLAARRSLARIGDILLAPDSRPPDLAGPLIHEIAKCAEHIRAAALDFRQFAAAVDRLDIHHLCHHLEQS